MKYHDSFKYKKYLPRKALWFIEKLYGSKTLQTLNVRFKLKVSQDF